uniref:Trehalase n=1 Tax=Pristhesancus plagipennis TaxID=1955184 RepID=A0A2K8JSN4_PRIPG|nr:secreted Trehalase-like protein [Pristhesancus plagipennis]
MHFLIIFYIIIQTVLSENDPSIPPSCSSQIYCQGDLLKQIQLSAIYQDSKTFVDKSLRYDPEQVIENFNKLKSTFSNGIVPREQLISFVNENFLNTSIVAKWTPPDWTAKPSIIKKIKDADYQKFALDLNDIWKMLGRKVHNDSNPDRESVIYLPNGFIAPGGRFNELYYWDALWVIKGLILCDMVQTAKGIIENFLYLVNVFGHIPNGSRVYYLERSQPPLLTLMVDAYYKATGDFQFIKDNIDIIDREMDYFNSARMIDVTVSGHTYKMYRYHAVSSGPRPESFREDYEGALKLPENDRTNYYIELKSGAESGWDFSSRWYQTEGQNTTLLNIRTSTIIPVDLNAILHKCFKLLSEWYNKVGHKVKSQQYRDLATQLQTAIDNVLWNEEDGIWYDYDLMSNSSRKYFYMSNFVPLWTKSYKFPRVEISKKIMHYILSYGLTSYVGGSPTSLDNSGQQWDFPNAWPPLQAFLIQGLENIGTMDTSTTAFKLASIWVKTNYKGFQKYHLMFEKYDSLAVGKTGGGGEYQGQTGFGWTNGFVLELLNYYGRELRS